MNTLYTYPEMADFERIHMISAEIEGFEGHPDRLVALKEKLAKARTWEHPRVTAKLSELRSRGLMDVKGNLSGINSLGRIGPEPGRRTFFAEE
jgi:hypothetical protein